MSQETISVFFNLAGLALTLYAIFLVARTSRYLRGSIRKGFVALLWGFVVIALSFVWSTLIYYVDISVIFNIQQILLAIGMVFILVAARRLFAMQPADSLHDKHTMVIK